MGFTSIKDPQSFEVQVDHIIKECKNDPEDMHKRLDSLMEEQLCQLGYYRAINKIRETTRHYS
jgi:hypothetical protein